MTPLFVFFDNFDLQQRYICLAFFIFYYNHVINLLSKYYDMLSLDLLFAFFAVAFRLREEGFEDSCFCFDPGDF